MKISTIFLTLIAFSASMNAKATEVPIDSTLTFNGITYQLEVDSVSRQISGAAIQSLDERYRDSLTLTIPSFIPGMNIHVTQVNASAFAGMDKLQVLTLPGTVTMIHQYACRNCTSLKTIQFSGQQRLAMIDNNAFEGCTSLEQFPFKSPLFHVGSCAFRNSGLTSVEMDDNLTYLGDSIFAGCTRLTDISFPAELTHVSDGILKGCTSLKTVDLSSTKVNWLGSQAFQGCTSLTTVLLPSTLTSVGSKAFADCNKIQEITSLAEIAPWCPSDAFSKDVFDNAKLLYPTGASGYTNQYTGWGNFKNQGSLSSIDGIDDESTPADAIDFTQPYEIYNLAGQRLNFLPSTPTLLIIRQGNQAKKLILDSQSL